MTKTDLAWTIANQAHRDQKRRSGESYINHIQRVVDILNALGWNDEETIITAILHDVLENTKDPTIKAHYIHEIEELGSNIISNVLILTIDGMWKVEGKNYQTYINDIISDGTMVLIRVKIADMLQNITDSPTEKQKEKYLEALPKLLKCSGKTLEECPSCHKKKELAHIDQNSVYLK
jgi:(p)ppGpp synthase/HD superfamily hydrolase